MLAGVYAHEEPHGITEKTAFLHAHGIALWDVIACCEITGSSDSSIRNAVPNDLGILFASCKIERIYANGKTAEKLYRRYLQSVYEREIIALPSTSPANASYSPARLIEAWSGIR